jgi:hypothetical protein
LIEKSLEIAAFGIGLGLHELFLIEKSVANELHLAVGLHELFLIEKSVEIAAFGSWAA